MWKNKPDMARKWTDEHGSTPVKAKKGKYQELEHPQHNITPIEHMEEKVSSKERIERLLNSRKAKKESKKKLVKEGQGFVPGWRPNLSVKAAEGELVREKTRGTGAAIKGTNHYVMEGMDAAQEGKLIQVPTRGTGQAVKGTDHYVMEGMDAAKEGKMIKAKKGIGLPPATKYKKYLKSLKKTTTKPSTFLQRRMTLGAAKTLGIGIKIPKTSKFTHRRMTLGAAKLGIGKKDALSKINFAINKASMLKNLSDKIKYPTSKAVPLPSKFVQRRMVLGSAKSILGKTKIGKIALGVAAVGLGAKEYLKHKSKKNQILPKKKPTKKSIGGETVVMKSGGGYIDDLL